MMMRNKLSPQQSTHWLLLSAILILSACSVTPSRNEPAIARSTPPKKIDVQTIPDAVPKVEPRSSRGNPPSYVVFGKRYTTLPTSRGYVERGIASWYGPDFHGKDTSSGEPYDMYGMTAAHKSLPLPCYVQVTNLRNGRHVVVRVNDRGPFHDTRIIDLSYTAAAKLDLLGAGTGLVEVRALEPGEAPVVTRTALGSDPNMYIQVGAFQNRINAEQMKARLQNIPAPVKVHTSAQAKSAPYRVRIGPLAKVDDVDQLSAKIKSMGIETYVVVE